MKFLTKYCLFVDRTCSLSNHPNMVLDPLIVAVMTGVNGRMDGHFWAKAPLFKGVLGWLLRHCGAVLIDFMVPVVRRTDLESGAIQLTPEEREHASEAMFEASYKLLGIEGGSLLVFPEGTSHSLPHIIEVKPGTARLVLGLLKKTGIVCPIVPVGLNYVEKDKMRSQVLVKFGEPIIPTLEQDDVMEEKVKSLTKTIETAIRNNTINADTWEDLMLIDLARQVYSSDYELSLQENVDLTQRFTKTYAQLQHEPKVAKLKEAVVKYKGILDSLNIPDRYFSRTYQRRFVLKAMIFHIIRVFLSLVLALPGYLVHFPLHYIGIKANKSKDKETITQTKLAVILLLVPIEYILVWTIVYFTLGFYWLIYALIALPVSGYLHVLELKEGKEHARTLMSLVRVLGLLLFRGSRIEEIRALRATISDGIKQLAKETFPDSILTNARKFDSELLEDHPAMTLKTFGDLPH